MGVVSPHEVKPSSSGNIQEGIVMTEARENARLEDPDWRSIVCDRSVQNLGFAKI
jgi:hypothetical protein